MFLNFLFSCGQHLLTPSLVKSCSCFTQAARSLQHLHQTQKKLSEARSTLKKLHDLHGHTEDYFKAQWARKKAIQSQTISQSSTDYLEHVAELVELEEQLLAAQ
jgi:hypothetical protein